MTEEVYFMDYIRKSYLYRLWIMLLSAYDSSVLRRVLNAAGRWCNQQIDESRLLAVLCREGYLARSWEASRLCKWLTIVVNLPIRLLQWLYGKLQEQFDTSFFAGLAFRMGDETAIAESWLILLLWIIPYNRWSNAYTLLAFLLLTCLLCVRGMHDKTARLDIASMGFYPVAFYVCVCLAVPLSVYPSLSARFLMYHAGAGFCLLVTISAVRNIGDLRRLLAGGSCAMAIASLYAVYQRIVGVDIKNAYVDVTLNPDMPGRVDSFYNNPNSFATFLALLIPLGIALMLCSKGWISRILAGGAVVLGVVALVMTYSRASWVAFAVSAAVFIFLWRPKLIPLFAAACVMCIPFLPSSVWDRILSIFNFADSSTSSRFALWAAALESILHRPILGIGLGTAAPQQYIAENIAYAGNHMYVHAHNLFLEVWLETGLFGVLAFCGSVFWNIKSAARKVRHCADSAARTIAAAASASLCGCLVGGLADYPWTYPRVMVVFWFVFAVAIASVKLCCEEQRTGETA